MRTPLRDVASIRFELFFCALLAESRIVLLSPESCSWMLLVAVDDKVHSVKPIDERP